MKFNNFVYIDRPCSDPVYGTSKARRLVKDFTFWFNDNKYIIPAGFEWDGASVPNIFWILIGTPHDSWFEVGSLIHDWLYLTHILPRATADNLFLQALIKEDVGFLRSRSMWFAVHAVGSFCGWPNTQADKEKLSKLKSLLYDREDRQYWIDQEQNWLKY